MVVKEDLSRMEGTYGAEMIGKLKKMDVLIVGLKGLGMETAKNLILAGPHSVGLHDDGLAEIADLGANFYLKPTHVGKPRAASVLPALKELNPNTNVTLVKGELSEEVLGKFKVVCITDVTMPLTELLRINKFCRDFTKDGVQAPIVFLLGFTTGATASLFSDFGPSHNVFDSDGEPCKTLILDSILQQEEGSVVIDGDRHLLSDGDHVKFEEVTGMSDGVDAPATIFKSTDKVTDINQIHVIKTTKNPKRFTIGNTTELGKYAGGGVATEVKQTKAMLFKSLKESMLEPEFDMGYIDFCKFHHPAQLHLAQLALWEFHEVVGRFPELHSKDDEKKFMDIAKTITGRHAQSNEKNKTAFITVEKVEEGLLGKYCMYVRTELTALCALFGGVLAQEITKQTGKYTPLRQWLHFDAFELLKDTPPDDATPQGTRFDHQIACFGAAAQEKIFHQKLFVVGCGALGCEYMKAVAMTGLGTRGGRIYCTDDDQIELSNLSRQFLFRRKHVGKAKSTSAAAQVVEMNPDMATALKTFEVRVEPKTEDVFDDAFWEGLDLVINALDNNQARKYTDGKCVLYEKPLFESGTLGTKANSVICLPHKTPSYSEGAQAGEGGGIAKCTLRNFPSIILHCIEWGREMFDEWFVWGPDKVNAFLEDPEAFFAGLDPMEAQDTLELTKTWVELSMKPSFELCVDIMLRKHLRYFRDGINDLIHNFPEDARNIEKSTGVDLGAFWHGHKRFPKTCEFDASNEEHVDFIYHGACILASVFGVAEQSREQVVAMAQKLKIPSWEYTGQTVDLSEGDVAEGGAAAEGAEEEGAGRSEQVQALKDWLSAVDVSTIKKLAPADFEKDDDTNHHIDVIRVGTNLRAFNYSIKPTTNQHCRMVAGKIIPAIATTTACITGFVQLEVYKYILGVPLESFRAATINLAVNTLVVENLPDPIKAKSGIDPASMCEFKAVPEGFTKWDKVEITTPATMTLQDWMKKFKEVHHNCTVTMLATVGTDQKTLFNDTLQMMGGQGKAQMDRNLAMPMLDLVTELAGPIFPAGRNYVMFEATVEDEESGDDAIIPVIRWTFTQ